MSINLPDNVTKHNIGDNIAYTIPVDNFQKLIGWYTDKSTWVHKDYKTQSKKRKKR